MVEFEVEINLEEELGRGIFSSRQARRAHRSISKNVFLEREKIVEVSVDRLSLASLEEAVSISTSVAIGRNRTFYGWAVLTVASACENNRNVLASPQVDNRYHADIVLPLTTAEDREEQIMHAQQLADASYWRPCPQSE